jgi:serine kinase
MDLANNRNLFDFLEHNGVVPEEQAKLWFQQMVNGVQYLHSKHTAHRDLKCKNILLSCEFDVKFSDFTFARFFTNRDSRHVLCEMNCGSPAYAPPEILIGIPYNPKLGDV